MMGCLDVWLKAGICLAALKFVLACFSSDISTTTSFMTQVHIPGIAPSHHPVCLMSLLNHL